MTSLRVIFSIAGSLLTVLAVALIAPAIVDLLAASDEWRAFVIVAALSLFVGISLLLLSHGAPARLTIHQGFLLTAASWLVASLVGALPLMFSDAKLGFTDAFFESVSGLTTTGATVITGLDSLPPGLLLWRALLHWIGGIGIIVMAVAILPTLQVGGMQLFRIEKSDEQLRGILPRATQMAGAIGLVYLALSAANALAYSLAGMNLFDAVTHAMATIATGGFSTHDVSIGFYDNLAVEIIAMVFMILGALPFVLYIRMAQGAPFDLLRDSQVRWYLAIIVTLIALVSLWNIFANHVPVGKAIRQSAFNVISVITCTGFVTADYAQWGSFPVTVFIFMMLIGGCTGSTAGGIKIFRYQVLYLAARLQILRLIQPHGVFPLHYGRKPLPEAALAAVMGFFFFYVFLFGLFSVGLSLMGYDTVTSLSGAATTLANTGPGLGNIIGPDGSFKPLSDGAKWLLSLSMLLGRLELFPILVLLVPSFWRD